MKHFGFVWYIVGLVFLFLRGINATTFIPLPFETQVRETNAIIFGTYLSKTYKRLPNGQVVTVASFKLHKSLGVDYKERLNVNKFDVSYPGGEWQGITYHVHGAPQFKPGEEVVLFLKKKNHQYMIQNLSMGKYKVEKTEEGSFLVSTLYPNHKYGKIPLDQFHQLASNSLGKEFIEAGQRAIVKSQHPTHIDKENEDENSRKLASIHGEEDDVAKIQKNQFIEFFWLLLVMMALTLLYYRASR